MEASPGYLFHYRFEEQNLEGIKICIRQIFPNCMKVSEEIKKGDINL
jgi:hypothetical protein